MNETPPRIDKWLWAVRAFKTRSGAAEACRLGRVMIAGQAVKASRGVKIGDVILIQQDERMVTLKVLKWLQQRVGAPIAKEYAEDLTPPTERVRPREPDFRPFAYRPQGAGRPTKKERRALGHRKD